MPEPATAEIAAADLSVRRAEAPVVAVVGNPNCGKSTLFNHLTGLRQKTANFPGVTVEKRSGRLRLDGTTLELVDLPGAYALSAGSMDERIAVDVLLGRMPGTAPPVAVLAVVDATRLYQGLFLLQQTLELGLPVVVAVTMMDAARREGISVDTQALSALLDGVPVCPVVPTTGAGIGSLKKALGTLATAPVPLPVDVWPELTAAVAELRGVFPPGAVFRPLELDRALIEGEGGTSDAAIRSFDGHQRKVFDGLRARLFGDEPPLAAEARRRYRWIRDALPGLQKKTPVARHLTGRIGDFIDRPVPAMLTFLAVMMVVFQAVFSWATPMMDLIDAAAAGLGAAAESALPPGALTSLLVDGVIAGVGSVVIFLPQILILFLFIILLEDTGYLARAAFLMDRAMRSVGLSGQSVIPMLSSFACAVPGIMATRVIPSRRDRIATMLAAPFMTCSARLPVYALLIAAFVPQQTVGWLNLQGLVLFGLYLLGIVGGALTALLIRGTALRGPRPSFILALPEFRLPDWRSVLIQLLDRARIFLRRAGTVIFTVALLVWALAYFPRAPEVDATSVAAPAGDVVSDEALAAELERLENEAAAAQLQESWLGRAGRAVEPVFEPLGWDWRVSAAVIAGFPAREVVVAVLGTIYAVGDDADESTLSERLKGATWPDGRAVFTLPMVLGLLVFYALCLQCAATLAVMRRETNTWRWPVFAWVYMTALGYVCALVIYQVGSL